MHEIQAKPEEGRSNAELMQDREAVAPAKRQLRVLDAGNYVRDKLRKAGMALQLYKAKRELREEKEGVKGIAEAVRMLDNPEGEIVGGKRRE